MTTINIFRYFLCHLSTEVPRNKFPSSKGIYIEGLLYKESIQTRGSEPAIFLVTPDNLLASAPGVASAPAKKAGSEPLIQTVLNENN